MPFYFHLTYLCSFTYFPFPGMPGLSWLGEEEGTGVAQSFACWSKETLSWSLSHGCHLWHLLCAVTSPSAIHQPLHPHLPCCLLIVPPLPLGKVTPHLQQGRMGTEAMLWRMQHATKMVLSTSGLWAGQYASRVLLISVPYPKDARGLLFSVAWVCQRALLQYCHEATGKLLKKAGIK